MTPSGERLISVVLLLSPLGQLVHIVGRADEMSGRAVPPVGSIGAMTGRQNGSTVLQGYTDDLGLVVGGNLQHVADTRGQIVAG